VNKVRKQCAELAGIDGIKIGPQVLRRSFNTLLHDAGVSTVVLRSIMGHSSQQMTDCYSGVSMARKQEVVGQLLTMTGQDPSPST
jgi:site-specific recombinase XerD